MSYLLPCSCGQNVLVEPRQAGGQVRCICGKELSVPTLRGLKQLKPATTGGESASRAATTRPWNPVRGAVFTSGLVLTFLSLLVIAVTLFQYTRVSGYTEDQSSQIHQLEAGQIDEFTLDQSIEAFKLLRDEGLDEGPPPYWVVAKEMVTSQWRWIAWASAVAVLGVVMSLAAVFAPANR